MCLCKCILLFLLIFLLISHTLVFIFVLSSTNFVLGLFLPVFNQLQQKNTYATILKIFSHSCKCLQIVLCLSKFLYTLIVLFNGNAHTANALLVSSLLSQSANRFCATTCVQLLCKDLCYLRMALTLCLHQFLCESWQICYRYTWNALPDFWQTFFRSLSSMHISRLVER